MKQCRYNDVPDAVLARPLSLPSYPVATGRPLPGHQRPRALRVRKGVTAVGTDAVLARPLSLPSYPVATGRPLPGHQRPRALRVRKGVKAGDRKSLNLNPGGPSRSSSIAPAETILRRARFFGTHAPRDKENQPEKCRRESTPESPDAVWRDPSRCRATP